MVFAALTALAHAGTIPDEDAGAADVAASSGAMISVFDTFGVVSNLGWWGLDLAMETAGYGERYGQASLPSDLVSCCSWCAPSCVVKFKPAICLLQWGAGFYHNTGTILRPAKTPYSST